MSSTMKRIILLGIVAVVGLVVMASVISRQNGLPPANPAAAAAAPTTRAAPAAAAAAAAAATPAATPAGQSAQSAVPAAQPARLEQLQQRLAENPRDQAALAEVVDYLFQAKKYAQAADLLSDALEVGPDNSRLRMGLGLAFFYQGMPSMAQRELKRAIDLDPDNVQAHFNYALAISHGAKANLEAARASWEAVVRIDGDGELGRRAKEFLAQPQASQQ